MGAAVVARRGGDHDAGGHGAAERGLERGAARIGRPHRQVDDPRAMGDGVVDAARQVGVIERTALLVGGTGGLGAAAHGVGADAEDGGLVGDADGPLAVEAGGDDPGHEGGVLVGAIGLVAAGDDVGRGR